MNVAVKPGDPDISAPARSPASQIRVLALMPYPIDRVPGQRFRLEQWAPLLHEAGVRVTFSPFLGPRAFDVLYRRGHSGIKAAALVAGYLRRLRDLARIGRFDLVYVYREAAWLGPAWLESLAARRRPIVFDFDDAFYLTATSEANRSIGFLKPSGKVGAICRIAACVTVGNETLARFAGRHAAWVEVLPTTIDTDRYSASGKTPNRRPIVGWTGSLTTAPYVGILTNALRRIRQTHDFELRVVGADYRADGLDVQCVPWRAETEVADLLPIDIGLMPLADDEWSRGKCALKALQYMALGIPPVVSPVGASAVVVQDGVNGFHARTDDEWVDRIGRLLGDPELRACMGTAARRRVEERYAARVQAPRLARILQQVCGRAVS